MDNAVAYAPGSTSNVGPGFDCLGIAVAGIGDRVKATRSSRPGVRVLSVTDPRIPLEADRNTAALAASDVLRRLGAKGGLELEVRKGLPLSGGLGGSAASAVAGAFAANAVLGGSLEPAELIASALEAEAVVAGRHPDNVAPSLLGGAVVVLGTEPLRYARLTVHPSLRFVFVTPGYGVRTAEARSVLPASVSRADAVSQAASLAALVLSLERGDAGLMRDAMRDRLAEPSRIPLYPGFPAARDAALAAGAIGVAVSGAGPTLLAVAGEPLAAEVARAAAAAYEREGRPPQAVHVAAVDGEGARLE
jgi:homoserine kinase